MRAVRDRHRPPVEGKGRVSLEEGGEWPGALLARRAPAIKQRSLDARSEGQPWPLPLREV